MTKDISYLVLSYPNFVLGTVINPDEANQNNADITNKINEFIDDVEEAWNNADTALTTANNVQTDYTAFKPSLEAAKANSDTATTNANTAATNANTAATNANNAALLASTDSIYRQALINGNFDVWQRGTSFNHTSGQGVIYTADRWSNTLGGTDTITISRQPFAIGQTEVPNNPKYFLRKLFTNYTSGYSNLVQKIEGVDTFAGMDVTLSFYARASVATTLNIMFQQSFGTAGSVTVSTNPVPIAITTAFNKYTVTVSLPSIVGKTVGANDCLSLLLQLPSIANGAYLDVAQVQLNVGNTALPFMPKSFAQELQDCMRYYQQTAMVGKSYSVNSISFHNPVFRTPMRITPLIVKLGSGSGASMYNGYLYDQDAQTSVALDVSSGVTNSSDTFGMTGMTKTNAFTVGHSYFAYIMLDAEL